MKLTKVCSKQETVTLATEQEQPSAATTGQLC